ncbi:AhpD family alkylhydroperoxidase [Streptomyces sp. V4I23]|nr:AhpD family alkylhydroperoxidase [Streptomyces sp. V4I23]
MDARLNLWDNPVAAKFGKHIVAAGKAISDSTLPAATQELVKIRASQINGCGFCTDMHTKEAAHAGETSTRLNLVAAWREAKVFTDAERAALKLAEQGTRIADAAGGVTDEAWAALRRGPARRSGVPHRPDQRVQPRERDRPAAPWRLPARPVRIRRRQHTPRAPLAGATWTTECARAGVSGGDLAVLGDLLALASARSSSPLAIMSPTMGVPMVPGQTAVIRMPRGAYSRAALPVGPITPCLEAWAATGDAAEAAEGGAVDDGALPGARVCRSQGDAGGGATDERAMRRARSVSIWRRGSAPSRMSSRTSAALEPSWCTGCSIIVSGGSMTAAQALSSNPMRDTSRGQASSRARTARRAPVTASVSVQNSAVTRWGRASIRATSWVVRSSTFGPTITSSGSKGMPASSSASRYPHRRSPSVHRFCEAAVSKHGTDFPVVFAGMAIAAVPVVLLFLFGQRYIVKGLADGIGK